VEEKFIQKLKEGSESAFKELVELYKNKVLNTCFGFVGNYADADDVAQDVFIEVYNSIGSFNQDSSISTWIYRIAVNKSLDFLRKAKRKKRWSSLIRISTDTKEVMDFKAVHHQTPQTSLEQKERVAILNLALSKLPANQKTAFTLKNYEDLSYAEIAEVMEVSISSVESLIHRAKLNLQKLLFNYYHSQN
jgi:RNA polymerase sigma-70 factor (ECF subfamily)